MRRALPATLLAVSLGAATLGAAGCGAPRIPQWIEAPPVSTLAPPPDVAAPGTTFAVSVRQLAVRRGGRSLPTTIWYPSRGGAVAPGRFPVVVFSHGLNRRPGDYADLVRRWAGAGFVVAAPLFPRTSRGVALDVRDVLNQPADVSTVLSQVLALDGRAGDPLRGHLDSRRVAAAGHSGGGVTTVGLFSGQRDDRLRAGVVLAGNGIGMGEAFAGPPASLLFVHGDRDPIVPLALSEAVYQAVPWPKAFLTVTGGGHDEPYSDPGGRAFSLVATLTIDFLRATLYGDPGARTRFSRRPAAPGRLDNRL